MRCLSNFRFLRLLTLLLSLRLCGCAAQPLFTICTYNLENYIDHFNPGRPIKSVEARAKAQQIIASVKPDILAVQEIGLESALADLLEGLRRNGLDYRYWVRAGGWDTNIFIAVLSRYPIVSKTLHTNETYLLHNRRFQLSRGFIEVTIAVTEDYKFTLFNAHLKSRREVAWADQAAMRLEEAKLLRQKIVQLLEQDPQANIAVVGDFNDTKDSKPVQTIVGQGRFRLIDTRPAERNGDRGYRAHQSESPRTITWTHYYAPADIYQRIDYILVSPGMAKEWLPEQSFVVTSPDWGVASDHRPVVAAFCAQDR